MLFRSPSWRPGMLVSSSCREEDKNIIRTWNDFTSLGVDAPSLMPTDAITAHIFAMIVTSDPSFVATTPKGLTPTTFPETRELIQAQVRLAQMGWPTFRLTHSMESYLLLTESEKIHCEDVEWPFRQFMISLPHPDGSLMMDVQGKMEPVREILVTNYEMYPDEVSNPIVQREVEFLRKKGTLTRSFFGDVKSLPVISSPSNIFMIRLYSESGVGLFNRFPFKPGERVVDLFKRYVGNIQTSKVEEVDRVTLKSALRIVVGLALYLKQLALEDKINLTEERPEKKSKGRKPPKPTKPRAKIWTIGEDIKIPREIREAAKVYAARGKNRPRWEAINRYLVSGYWQKHAYGKNFSQRKIIHVKPYWRGPEGGETAPRNYLVDLRKK